MTRLTRRAALGAGSATLVLALAPTSRATPKDVEAAMADILKGRLPRPGRIKLDIPRLAESGLNVSLDVSVESPMTEADHVTTIHLLAEQNPLPAIARYHFSPRSGRASVSTRIRLADSQIVTALCEMNDGSVWIDRAEVVITIMACGLEPT